MLRDEKGRFIKGNKGFWKGKKRKNVSRSRNYRWVGEKNNYNCLICRKRFRRSLPTAGGLPKYCSSKCYGKSKKGNWIKDKNPNWNGGTTSESSKIRNSEEYKEWRMRVLKRDRFSCVKCGYRSKQSYAHGDGKCDIRVDHTKPFSLYPHLRFEVKNGRTLCVPCDKVHGWNYNRNKTMKTLRDYTPSIAGNSVKI